MMRSFFYLYLVFIRKIFLVPECKSWWNRLLSILHQGNPSWSPCACHDEMFLLIINETSGIQLLTGRLGSSMLVSISTRQVEMKIIVIGTSPKSWTIIYFLPREAPLASYYAKFLTFLKLIALNFYPLIHDCVKSHLGHVSFSAAM